MKHNDDNSIIDVTSQVYTIDSSIKLQEFSGDIPQWQQPNPNAYFRLEIASAKQKIFYSHLKNSFLKGVYLDLKGNSNYAFVLLFDVMDAYEVHNDVSKIKAQLKILEQCYSVLKACEMSSLFDDEEVEIHEEKNMSHEEAEAIFNSIQFASSEFKSIQFASPDFDDFYLGYGSKYRQKLNLSKNEEALLNGIQYNKSNFEYVECCFVEILKLYLAVIAGLEAKYAAENTTLADEFQFVADLVARKQFKYRNGSSNYSYCVRNVFAQFSANIFKVCVNTVRDFYGNKRKLNTFPDYANKELKLAFELRINSKISDLLQILTPNLPQLDEETELRLNSEITNRWKTKYDELTANFEGNSKDFMGAILELVRLNKESSLKRNILFEASKFIAKYAIDAETALKLFVHYRYHDLRTEPVLNKTLPKTILKRLLKTDAQLNNFEQILDELVKDENLDKALEAIPQIFEVKRKKIQLDKTTIKEVQEQHSGTVELLNEYLRDEVENEDKPIEIQKISSEKTKIETNENKEKAPSSSAFHSELALNSNQVSILELFAKNNFSIQQSKIEDFAKSKGLFKNQVIESINEACYELLDDVLIEEEDNCYAITPEYFQKILANDR
jgi:hypothetical protein